MGEASRLSEVVQPENFHFVIEVFALDALMVHYHFHSLV